MVTAICASDTDDVAYGTAISMILLLSDVFHYKNIHHKQSNEPAVITQIHQRIFT